MAADSFSTSARVYMAAHAIDPALAAHVGVSERDGALVYPYCGGRRRPLDGDRTFQPAGVPLALWWPSGKPASGAHVLLCEGEPDALAAMTALAGCNGKAPIDVPVAAALPGTGGARIAVETLADVGQVTLAMDGDEPGRKCSATLARELRAAGHEVRAIELPDGKDLADELAAVDDRHARLVELLAAAEPVLDEPEPADSTEAPTHSAETEKAEQAAESQPSQAVRLVKLAEMLAAAGHLELFHAPDGAEHATVAIDGHRETLRVRSRAFRGFLANEFYDACGGAQAANGEALSTAVELLATRARHAVEHVVNRRVAGGAGAVYLDVADDERRVVEVTARGWRLVSEPVVRFVRPPGIRALPIPAAGGSVDELRPFVHCDDQDFRLLVAFLLAALRPTGPYPHLDLHGEQGAGKSTIARIVQRLTDPHGAGIRCEPREAHDLAIAAENAWLLAYDNLSSLPPWLSDSLCRLSTGGGFATRTLYSDRDEELFEAQRPVVLTGIAEIATRADLLDRALVVHLPRLAESERRGERELWAEFDAAAPRILGALLHAVSCALRNIESVHLDRLPRMADFAEWIVAAEPALPWKPGGFLAAYERNREAAVEITLEDSPLVEPLQQLIGEGAWAGTATKLLEALGDGVGEQVQRRREWPKTARGLSGALRRLAPALRQTGLDVEFDEREAHTGRRLVTVRDTGSAQGRIQPSPPSRPSPPLTKTCAVQGKLDSVAGDGRVTQTAPGDGQDRPDRHPPIADVGGGSATPEPSGDGGDAKSRVCAGPAPDKANRRALADLTDAELLAAFPGSTFDPCDNPSTPPPADGPINWGLDRPGSTFEPCDPEADAPLATPEPEALFDRLSRENGGWA